MNIFAVDPGTEKSAWVLLDGELRPVAFGIEENGALLGRIRNFDFNEAANAVFAIEMFASMGMTVGKEVFETVAWLGRFEEAARLFARRERVFRREEKLTLCGNSRAKDANIRQALIDRFGGVGTKAAPGWFYGVSKDVWAAIAVGVTLADREATR